MTTSIKVKVLAFCLYGAFKCVLTRSQGGKTSAMFLEEIVSSFPSSELPESSLQGHALSCSWAKGVLFCSLKIWELCSCWDGYKPLCIPAFSETKVRRLKPERSVSLQNTIMLKTPNLQQISRKRKKSSCRKVKAQTSTQGMLGQNNKLNSSKFCFVYFNKRWLAVMSCWYSSEVVFT